MPATAAAMPCARERCSPRFIAAARAGQPLRVYGEGSQTRCFCLVTDTVRVKGVQSSVGGQQIALLGAPVRCEKSCAFV